MTAEMAQRVQRASGWYRWTNLVLNQAAWVAAVVGGAHMAWWPGVGAVALVVGLDLACAPDRRRTAARLAGALALGLLIDSALGLGGACAWTGGGGGGRLPPLWLVALWPNFATLLTASLAWLAARPLLAGLLGMVGAPCAYASAARLHALTFPSGEAIGLGAVALAWLVATPLLALDARAVAPPRAAHG
jgi:hypothetical protein